jgi:Ca-activated chloride channel family protein
MMSPDKLPLVKSAFRLLVDQLREQDRVAIVVYAGNAGLVLPSTSGSDRTRIMEAIDRLEAGGSTAGGAGIRLAYDVARGSHLAHGNNRVILATDGDFNVGTSSDAELERLIESRRDEGTFLTVLGFGTGNLKDAKMEKLADRGNGNYAYVDGPLEAKKVFVHELGGTLLTVAKDVKLQVEFNPARVAAYRLLGYENRLLRDEDFNDDAKDAGDLGSGHAVTALYEVVPVGASDAASVIRGVDPLRYQRPQGGGGSDDDGPVREYAAPRTPPSSASRRDDGAELMYVKLRYKQPDGHTSRLMQRAVLDAGIDDEARPSADFTFAAAVAEFALVLRESDYRGQASLGHALRAAERSLGGDEGGYRAGFVELVRKARGLREGGAIAVERE